MMHITIAALHWIACIWRQSGEMSDAIGGEVGDLGCERSRLGLTTVTQTKLVNCIGWLLVILKTRLWLYLEKLSHFPLDGAIASYEL
jgi:hypothetical protein